MTSKVDKIEEVKGDAVDQLIPMEVIERKILIFEGKKLCWMPIWRIFMERKPRSLSKPSSVISNGFLLTFCFSLVKRSLIL